MRKFVLSSAKSEIKLLVFTGNPGQQYRETRHNAGWLCLETLEKKYTVSWNEKFNSRLGDLRLEGQQVRLQQPLSFMNKTGEPVRKAMDFFGLKPEEILVIHDELELPFGTVQVRQGGGLGGHNGLRSLNQQLGTPDFFRLRFGISRPVRGDVSAWVLSRFSTDEMPLIEILTQRTLMIIEDVLLGNKHKLTDKKLNILEGSPL